MTTEVEAFEGFTSVPEAPIGTHPGIVSKCEPTVVETRDGPWQCIRWEVTITDEDGLDSVVDGLSGRDVTPRTKAGRWLKAIGAYPEPGAVTPAEAIVGRPCLVVVGRNDSDYATLEDLIAPVSKGKK